MSGFVERLSAELDLLGVQYEVKGEEGGSTWLEAHPADDRGFEVAAQVRPDWADRERTREVEWIIIWYVYMTDGWYQEFDSGDQALACFMSGIRGERRLAVEKRGGRPTSWSAEELVDNRWVPVGTKTRALFSPFWRKRTIEYLCNGRTPQNDD